MLAQQMGVYEVMSDETAQHCVNWKYGFSVSFETSPRWEGCVNPTFSSNKHHNIQGEFPRDRCGVLEMRPSSSLSLEKGKDRVG